MRLDRSSRPGSGARTNPLRLPAAFQMAAKSKGICMCTCECVYVCIYVLSMHAELAALSGLEALEFRVRVKSVEIFIHVATPDKI